MLSSYLIFKIIGGFNSLKKFMIKEPPIQKKLGKKIKKNFNGFKNIKEATIFTIEFAKNQWLEL